MEARGDFVDGRFVGLEGEPLRSTNPAADGRVVFETASQPAHVAHACDAAARASLAWAALDLSDRFEVLSNFKAAIEARRDSLADALVLEIGKLRAEAVGEVNALVNRFAGVKAQVERDLKQGPLPGFPTEWAQYHPHGVVGVIGPYNYPLHLVHAHVVPALLLGNAVVIKPSEIAPLCAQRYAEAAAEAGFPAGVFNMVQGGGAVGAALANHPSVRGICFTGSYEVGQKLKATALRRPELLLALELGGKNTAVIMPDADLRQAAHEIAVGGYLTTGQRCTCTDRVLVHHDIKAQLIEHLRRVVSCIEFGDPESPDSFAGPLVTQAALQRYEDALQQAETRGCEVIIPHRRSEGGFYAQPSLYLMPDGRQEIEGYSDVEVFGPNVAIEEFADLDDAIEQLQSSPYGLANAVFTRTPAAFDKIYGAVHAGVWNLNRTTNQASPRLPFGGVGRSGNARPAGSHAPRNVVYPVAVQRKVAGGVAPHAKLLHSLPAEDLDQLDALHTAEEAAEAKRDILALPRPMTLSRPVGGRLEQSNHWLERFYAGERFAREKKPSVFDHMRSQGPWLVSVDDVPMSTLDAMSQTATVCGGFAEDAVVDGWVNGAFGDSAVFAPDTSIEGHPAVDAFADALRAELPGLAHVSFTNSGAEANEKALGLCLLHADAGRTRILAFEGSFHGRTLLALHSTWNPVKRQPFELPGYATSFAPFPAWTTPNAGEPEAPSGWLAAVAAGNVDALRAIAQDADDALLSAEAESLASVDQILGGGDHFALIVEPMQSEGGDRYATARFHRSLRLLTRHHGVAMIYDEVQCGFGLGGGFAWHRSFGLVDANGDPDTPDAVTFAKRAQVGACVSVFEDPEPSAAHPASLVRGRIHVDMVRDGVGACRMQGMLWPRLQQIAAAYPQLVANPRCRGYAMAFDLPTPALAGAFIAQRWWRGAVVYAAGKQTARFRLSLAFEETHVDQLFVAIRRTLSWLDAHPGQKPPAWEDLGQGWTPSTVDATRYRIRQARPDEADALVPKICALEDVVYEPARRDPPEKHRLSFGADGVVIVAEVADGDDWQLVGKSLAVPLETFPSGTDGLDHDPNRGRNNTVYSSATTVHPDHHGQGLGTALKLEQVRAARALTQADGSPRYRFLTGRTRVGAADDMMRINRRFGAHVMDVYGQQYGEDGAQARYYRIPLGPLASNAPAATASDANDARDLVSPLATAPPSLVQALETGQLAGPTVTKITICNFITPAISRAIEWVSALVPELPHLYLTSGRDEGIDKCVRLLRYHRPQANIAISLSGAYVGHTSAACRTLSDPAVHRAGKPYFDWPRIPHPADVGCDATLDALREAVTAAGGPEHILGLFVEVVQERTGRTIPPAFWPALHQLRADLGVPVVMVETASAHYRSGLGAFAMNGLPFHPDLMTWWSGGQNGFVHVSSPFYINKPLAMVSTWDGDELSLIRLHHQLRMARGLSLDGAIGALGDLGASAAELGIPNDGLGLFRVFRPDDVSAFEKATGNVKLRRLPGGAFAFAPKLDVADDVVGRLVASLTGN